MIKSHIKLILIALLVGTVLYNVILPVTKVWPDTSLCEGPDDNYCKFGSYSTNGFPLRISEWNGGATVDDRGFSIRHASNNLIWVGAVYILLFAIKRFKK